MLPRTALGSLAFDRTTLKRERMRLTVGHSQHIIILDALSNRDAQRAERMMIEHSHATLNYHELFVDKGHGSQVVPLRPNRGTNGQSAALD